MNIVYATPEFVTEKNAGGLATYLDNISRILAYRGNHIIIIVMSEFNNCFEYAHNIYVYRVCVDFNEVDMHIPGIIYRKCSNQINRKLDEIRKSGKRIDIVQYANWKAFALERLNIPTVVRISSDLPLWRASENLNFDINRTYECTKITDYLEDISLMRSDAVFGPSFLLAKIIGERMGSNIDVIETPFYRAEDTLSNIKVFGKYIFTFGTLKLMKGIKLIGDCISEILSQHPDIKYVFAGTEGQWQDAGNTVNAIDYIKDKAGANADRVIYCGKLKRDEVCYLASNSEVCVLPSRIDNLPNTCIEAMANGAIVIGTRGASFEQLIINGKNGFLIERENDKELIKTINNVLKLGQKERLAIIQSAMERVDFMNPDKIADETLHYYAEVIAGYKLSFNKNYYQLLVEKYNNEILFFDKSLMLK